MSHFCRGSATCQVRLPDDADGRHGQDAAVGALLYEAWDVLTSVRDAASFERRNELARRIWTSGLLPPRAGDRAERV